VAVALAGLDQVVLAAVLAVLDLVAHLLLLVHFHLWVLENTLLLPMQFTFPVVVVVDPRMLLALPAEPAVVVLVAETQQSQELPELQIQAVVVAVAVISLVGQLGTVVREDLVLS
jgi:hypothetical protein